MSNKKISELTAYSTPVSGDILPINDTTNTTTKKITVDNLFNILSSLFRIKDSTDTTKKVAFDVSGVTTATTRTITIPNANTTMVGTDTTQTLSGKTLTSPKLTVGSDAAGDLHYTSNADGTQSRLAIGTNNYILRSNGSAPTWSAESVNADASTTVAGVVELATSAEITAGTATGGDGPLVVTPDQLLLATKIAKLDYQAFTADGTWNKPSFCGGDELVFVQVWGAGGGGGGGTSGVNAGGGAGGGGAYTQAVFKASDLASTVSVTVATAPAGGAGSAGTASAGTAGGTSSFGSLLQAFGGGGGGGAGAGGDGGGGGGGGLWSAGTNGSTNNPTGGAGGAPGGGAASTDAAGFGGGGGTASTTSGRGVNGGGGGARGNTTGNPGSGAPSVYGGGGGAAGGTSGQGTPGTSVHGGTGGTTGNAGTAPGGGGGGGVANGVNTGGAGGRGEVRVFVL